mgnify:CR=1 FL=1
MKRLVWYTIIGLSALILTQCANSISPPQGGPKDVTPPVALETTPENRSANFTGKSFIIKFNEFVKLENVEQSALISPPMKEAPDYKVKGKTIQVKFNEDLKPNTTYSVYFGDAIVDITESNPLSNFTYIFSTGDYVDSLSIYGNVINAFDLLPVEAAYVMLYKDNNDTIQFDSLPYFVVPYYLSKTNVDGKLQFSGLSDDDFLIFSINDQNSNYIFDQPGEQIAFLDSLIHPTYFEQPKIDSIAIDSIAEEIMVPDTIMAIRDSIANSIQNEIIDNNRLDLFMFLSPDTIQRLLKAEVVEKNNIRFSFSQPARNVKFEMLKYYFPDSLRIEVFSKDEDTLTWYLRTPPIDSLELFVTQYEDTLGTAYLKLDPEKKSARIKKKEKDEKKVEPLRWKSNIISNIIGIGDSLNITFSQPMVNFNNIDSSLVVIETDTILDPDFRFTDSLRMNIIFPFKTKEETRYRIYFPDSAFSSWNNIHTEAIDMNFKTLPLKEYGILTFNLHPIEDQNYIFQLMDENEVILQEVLFINDTTISFEYLKPANYIFKIVFDTNKNNIWDPGNYGLMLQPEHVIYYQKEVKVRANWEIEEDWEF